VEGSAASSRGRAALSGARVASLSGPGEGSVAARTSGRAADLRCGSNRKLPLLCGSGFSGEHFFTHTSSCLSRLIMVVNHGHRW